jgi:hypothetical protein
MNPSFQEAVLEREQRLDPERYQRDYEATFVDDITAVFPAALVDGAIVERGRREQPPEEGRRYVAAVDPAGGGPDAFTLAIVHAEGAGIERRVGLDVMRGWRFRRSGPTDLAGVVQQIAGIVRAYGLTAVTGDRYAGASVRERFQAEGITYHEAEHTRSLAYLALEPLLTSGALDLLDEPTLLRELKGLERRARPGGQTVVDHRPGEHDDFANAVALAVATALATVAVSAAVLIRRPHPPAVPAGPMARLEALRRSMRARPRVTGL